LTRISEAEFERLVNGIREDRDPIIKHNPIGTDEEILLWMLLAVLSSYLNLIEQETPCFTGKPDANTYREAIRSVLRDRKELSFDLEAHLDKLC
jgi:hypothetical protein